MIRLDSVLSRREHYYAPGVGYLRERKSRLHRHLRGLLLQAGHHPADPPQAGGWLAFLDSCSLLFQAADERNFLGNRMLKARTGEVQSLYQELLSQRDLLRFLLEEVPVGMACFDGRGELQLVNSMAQKWLGGHTQLRNLIADTQGDEQSGRLQLPSGLDREYRWVALRRHGELRASCLIFPGSESPRPLRVESDAKLRSQLETAQQQVKRYESAFAQLKQRLINFSQELAQSQSECAELRLDQSSRQQELVELQLEVESLRAETRKLPAVEAHELLRSQLEQADRQLQQAQSDNRELREQLEQARVQLQQARQETAQSQRGLASKEAHILELQEALLSQEATQWPQPLPRPVVPTRSLRVLLVEDEPISLLVTQECIESQGHQCVIAEDGNEALRWAGRQAVDVVITSYHMPGMNGVVLCRKLQQLEPDRSPFCILLTSMDKPEESLQAREAGMHILSKPLDPAELERVLSEVAALEETP